MKEIRICSRNDTVSDNNINIKADQYKHKMWEECLLKLVVGRMFVETQMKNI